MAFLDDAADLEGNYLIRHWRGGLPLALSFWVNTMLFGFLVSVGLVWLLEWLAAYAASVQIGAILWIAYLILFLASWIWSQVGTWRSAGRHGLYGGSEFWAGAARVVIGLSVVGMIGQAARLTIQTIEFASLAIGGDPIGNPARFALAPDGTTMTIRGNLTSGTADRLEEALGDAPRLRTIVIESDGGRILEGQRIAELVRQRRLDTRVDRVCMSACTFVLIAGQRRMVTPRARVGFHQPSFPGMNEADLAAMIDNTRRLYSEAGIESDFLERVMQVPAYSMWFPSHDRLIEANVITGQTETRDGFRRTFLATPFWQAFARNHPEVTDEVVAAAWRMHVAEATERQMQAVVRTELAKNYHRILARAPGELIDEFGRIAEAQMREARRRDAQACVMVAENRLDVVRALPAELVAREQRLFERAAEIAPGPPIEVSDELAGPALGPVVRSLTGAQRQLILDGDTGGTTYETRCGALIALWSGVNRLPAGPRRISIRFMLSRGT